VRKPKRQHDHCQDRRPGEAVRHDIIVMRAAGEDAQAEMTQMVNQPAHEHEEHRAQDVIRNVGRASLVKMRIPDV
jgi:hypothetical protein